MNPKAYTGGGDIYYIKREDLEVGDKVTYYGRKSTVVELLGFDPQGRHGIKWSNGMTDYHPLPSYETLDV